MKAILSPWREQFEAIGGEAGKQERQTSQVKDRIGKRDLFGEDLPCAFGGELDVRNHDDRLQVSRNGDPGGYDAAGDNGGSRKAPHQGRRHIVGMAFKRESSGEKIIRRELDAGQTGGSGDPGEAGSGAAAKAAPQWDAVDLVHSQSGRLKAQISQRLLCCSNRKIPLTGSFQLDPSLALDLKLKSLAFVAELYLVIQAQRHPQRIKSRSKVGG
jgi:hypothetical protein